MLKVVTCAGFPFLLLASLPSWAQAQKRALDFNTVSSWPKIEGQPEMSNDGKFILYNVHDGKNGTVIQATGYSWKMVLPLVKKVVFTQDSHRLIYITKGDSLGVFDLADRNTGYIANVSSFEMPDNGDGRWLVYRSKGFLGDLTLLDLFSGEKRSFTGVLQYCFDRKGNTLLLQIAGDGDNSSARSYRAVKLNDLSEHTISNGFALSNPVFDHSGTKLAFFANELTNGKSQTVIRYYAMGMDSAEDIVTRAKLGTDELIIDRSELYFDTGADKLFFNVGKPGADHPTYYPETKAQLTISGDKRDMDLKKKYWAAINLDKTAKIICLENDSYGLNSSPLSNDGNWAITERYGNNSDEYKYGHNTYLISTKTGVRKPIGKAIDDDHISFSPGNKYVIWYERTKKQWFSYRLKDGLTKCISKEINRPLDMEIQYAPGYPGNPEGIVAWMANDCAVLVYDRHDIWEVDPDGKIPPVDLTSGYGRRNHIRLRVIDFSKESPIDAFENSRLRIHNNDALLLAAFNDRGKSSGFFKLTLGKTPKLQKLTMGNSMYCYAYRYTQPSFDGMAHVINPVKAKYANAYIVAKMDFNEYPNLYFTTDFENFKPITDFQPQKDYNWLTNELVHWKLPNGRPMEGMLYKPEDFDPAKKYPVIFYIYEENADYLHYFIYPQLSDGPINIPWFVSHGYLVFVPDVSCYKLGYPMECAYRCVRSAALYLSTKPFIDAHRMGLQGHSYGGWETDYILTRTHIFAAACSASDISDIISLNAQQATSTRDHYFESGQGRLGASFWKKPGLYIQNSPVYHADRVATPLLLMHNKPDAAVLFSQAEEWYNSLVHLNKKAWLLSYANSGHVLDTQDDCLDYSIRVAQFFDHYLKGAPPPKWMTTSAAVQTGNYMDIGYDLDTSGRQP